MPRLPAWCPGYRSPVAFNIESNIEADIVYFMVDIKANGGAGIVAGSFQFDFE